MNKPKESIKNIAKCLLCGDIIESKHRHDYVTCKCGNLSVDGGKDYCKRSVAGDQNSYVDMTEVKFLNKENDYCSDCDPITNPKCDKCLGC